MSDEKQVPETLETIAAGVRALITRFDAVDRRFDAMDTRFDELKAQLQIEIESVRGDLRLVAEAFGDQARRNRANDTEHKTFEKRLDGHQARIVALERKKRRA